MTTDGPGGGLIDRLREFTEQYASEIRSEFESQLTRLRAYDDQLTAVMPQDFKDWHKNSFAERPEIAAAVIMNLRARLTEAQNRTGGPGVMHEVDKAFYNLAIAERNRANDVIRCQQETIKGLKVLSDSHNYPYGTTEAKINASLVMKIEALVGVMQGESCYDAVEKMVFFLKKLSTVCREFIGPTRSPASLTSTITEMSELIAKIEDDNHIRFETNARIEE